MAKLIETKLEPYRIGRECDCGGKMKHIDGRTLLTNPPKYHHKCSKCGEEEYLNKIYPSVEFKESTDKQNGCNYRGMPKCPCCNQDLRWLTDEDDMEERCYGLYECKDCFVSVQIYFEAYDIFE